jgi:hypothetical protein
LTKDTLTKDFLSYIAKEILQGDPNELDDLAQRLMKDYIRTVK